MEMKWLEVEKLGLILKLRLEIGGMNQNCCSGNVNGEVFTYVHAISGSILV